MDEHKSSFLSEHVTGYLVSQSAPPGGVLTRLAEETAALGRVAIMQISPEQGALMELLTHAVSPRFAVEIGTFTGYSAICVARALPPEGRLLCCDTSKEWTTIARRYWAEAGVADRIDLELGPALDTLRALPPHVQIDLAFVDADKANYVSYYEELISRLSPRGLILVDNVLWQGRAADPPGPEDDEHLVAIRAFNDHVASDARTRSAMIAVGDGLTLIRRA